MLRHRRPPLRPHRLRRLKHRRRPHADRLRNALRHGRTAMTDCACASARAFWVYRNQLEFVMAALEAAIHLARVRAPEKIAERVIQLFCGLLTNIENSFVSRAQWSWMAGSSPAMTVRDEFI